MKTRMLYKLFLGLICAVPAYAGDTHYVIKDNIGASSPFTSWLTAASNIQQAISAPVADTDTVLVSNGVYNTGGAQYYTYLPTNRVLIVKQITLRAVSTNPADTVIVGYADPSTNTGCGPAAIRCIYMDAYGAGSTISGFTITNGHSAISGSGGAANGGGITDIGNGSLKSTITNCVIVNCAASGYGGGASGGRYFNCEIRSNVVYVNTGGGAYYANFDDCLISGNTALNSYGGGMSDSSATNNCRIIGNYASNGGGGGVNITTVYGSILSNNVAIYGGGGYDSRFYGCTIASNRAISTLGRGGAHYSANSGLFKDCFISSNYSENIDGISGGVKTTYINCTGVYNVAKTSRPIGPILATNCLFAFNQCLSNGTMFGVQDGSSLTGCRVISNRFDYQTGAIFFYRVYATNCEVRGNNGASIFYDSSRCVNSVIAENSATTDGSAGMSTTFINCTIASNTGVRAVSGGSCTNSIVYNNPAGNHFNTYFGRSCTYPLPTGGYDSGGNTTNEPQFINLGAGSYRLSALSPGIDAGTNQPWMDNAVDMDGRVRIRYGTVDMGAYEFMRKGTIISLN